MTPDSAAVLALLVAGHALGDFVFQTKWMIERKDRGSGLVVHVLVVALCQLALIAPYLNRSALLAVAVISLAHLVIDAAKTWLSRRTAPRFGLLLFALDQLAHLAVIGVAWMWLAPRAAMLPGLFWMPGILAAVGVLVAAFAFNVNGMSAVVLGVLGPLGITPREEGPAIGRTIGILERMFALTLVLNDQWSALGFLVAAKSLARFKDLENRRNAEYYLVGTLVSLLGATVTAITARWILMR